MDRLATRVLARYLAKVGKPYGQPKETKEHRVKKVQEVIVEKAGLSKGMAGAIADAYVRSGRNLEELAVQKGWPISDGRINGKLDIKELPAK
jgi:hypothetical protein